MNYAEMIDRTLEMGAGYSSVCRRMLEKRKQSYADESVRILGRLYSVPEDDQRSLAQRMVEVNDIRRLKIAVNHHRALEASKKAKKYSK